MKYLPSILILLFGLAYLFACSTNSNEQGKNLYNAYCANCHMEDGSGLEALIPPLANTDYWSENQEALACIIRYGIADTILVNGQTYSQPMAGIPELTKFQIANIINYVNQAWGNQDGFLTMPVIEAALENCDPGK